MPKIGLDLTRPMVLPQHVEFDEERITLGRSKSCTCFIEDRFLSRTHAVLVAREGKWFISDCDSANGTFVNSVRIDREVEFRFNDVVTIGDTEIRMGGVRPQDEITAVGIDAAPSETPEPVTQPDQIPDLVIEQNDVRESTERTMIVHRLALELIGERSTSELYDIVVEHVMEALTPSRVAIALLGDDDEALEIVRFRSAEGVDESRLTISRTLLSQIIDEKKVVAYTDIGSEDGEIPESMVVQGIFSALGAPLLVNDRVLGVLYLDHRLTDRTISEDDAQLAAQIARVAAIKVDSLRRGERRGMSKADLVDLYRFNDWANARMVEVVRTVAPDTLTRELGGSHRCIRNVLAHIVSAEWVWLERWEGTSPSVVPDWVDAADVPALIEILSDVERRRAKILEKLAVEKLHEPHSFRLMSGESRVLPLVDLIRHVVDHSSYHRGQLASMLRQCDVAPPSIAFIEYRGTRSS